MELKDIIVISRRPINISGVAYQVGGVDKTISGYLSIHDWISQIISDCGGGTVDYTDREYTKWILDDKLEIKNKELAKMLGLPVNTLIDTYPYYSTSWGNSKLILQNANNSTIGINSVLTSFEEVENNMENSTELLRDGIPLSDYNFSADLEIFKANVSFFPNDKKIEVKRFLSYNASNESERANIFGLDFKIPNTEIIYTYLEFYKGFKEQYSNKNLKTFSIGFVKEM